MQSQQKLMKTMGYQFQHPEILRRALTHPSMGGEDNQRLEFLGDAVLQYLVSDQLFRSHPGDQEGSLTHFRSLLVCEEALSLVARSLGIGEALIMDHGEELSGGRTKPSVLCDAMEAVLAAVYLDGGMEAARELIRRFWPEPEEVHRPLQDSKGALQEVLQRDGGETPVYTILSSSGPVHAPHFEAQVSWMGRILGRGDGGSKKDAEKAAALDALRGMGKDVE